MPVKLDEFGYPIDPELRRLRLRLGQLAVAWGDVQDNLDLQRQIAQEYQEILEHLYEVGWDSELHFEVMLPDEYMPEEYFRRHPEYKG